MDKELFTYYRQATLDNLCSEYKNEWKKIGDDKMNLVALSLRQQSIPHVAHYCYRGDSGITTDYIVKNFSEYINGVVINDCDNVSGYKYALHVRHDDVNVKTNEVDVLHFMECHADATVSLVKCPVLYVSNKSDLKVSCEGYNNVRIYMFDESKITLEDVDETCSVIVYKYDERCKVELGKFAFGKVQQHNKELRL